MIKKLILIIFGVLILISGILLTFGILISSIKENDNEGFYGFFISIGLIILGIYSFIRGLKINPKQHQP